MDDLISIPRLSLEALIQVANQVLSTTDPTGPDNLERAEVTLKNSIRKNLKEAVYQAEKAIHTADITPSQTRDTSTSFDEEYSRSKESWIARCL